MLAEFINGNLGWDAIKSVPILSDVTGRRFRLSRILEGVVTLATKPQHRKQGDRLQQLKLAFVMDRAMMHLVGANDPKELVSILNDAIYTAQLNGQPQLHRRGTRGVARLDARWRRRLYSPRYPCCCTSNRLQHNFDPAHGSLLFGAIFK